MYNPSFLRKTIWNTEEFWKLKKAKVSVKGTEFFTKRLVFFGRGKEGEKSHSPWSCCFQKYLQSLFLGKYLGDKNINTVVSAACYMRASSIFSITMINIFMAVRGSPASLYHPCITPVYGPKRCISWYNDKSSSLMDFRLDQSTFMSVHSLQ